MDDARPDTEPLELDGLSGSTSPGTIIAVIARRPNVICEEAAGDLLRLIGSDLARKAPAEMREEKLGLMVELVSETAEVPTTSRYEAARKAARDDDAAPRRDWPSAQSLIDSYKSWKGAVKAACRIAFGDDLRGISDSYRHSGHQRPYEEHEAISALIKSQRELELPEGVWPTQAEYEEWTRLTRAILRNSGKQPRVPGRKQIADLYGSWASAIQAVQAHVERCRQ